MTKINKYKSKSTVIILFTYLLSLFLYCIYLLVINSINNMSIHDCNIFKINPVIVIR